MSVHFDDTIGFRASSPPPFDSTLFMDDAVIFTMHYNIGSLHEHCNCCHLTPIGILIIREETEPFSIFTPCEYFFQNFSLELGKIKK